MNKEYSIGLDIGTNSVGWAVMTDDYKVPSKKMKIFGNTDKKYIKKNLIGTLLFDKGDTAKNRRLKRGTRRRYTRRRYRLDLLREYFVQEISVVDESFFQRLDDSFKVVGEKRNEKHQVFPTVQEEVGYHKTYPTIYHLREALASEDRKFDIRLVYLAIAHIFKSRGHFLFEGDFSVENLNLKEVFREFLNEYQEVFGQYHQEDVNSFELTGSFENLSKSEIAKELENQVGNGQKNIKYLKGFCTLISGNQYKIQKEFDLEQAVNLKFSDEEYESNLEKLLEQIGNEYEEVFNCAKRVYDAIQLSKILDAANPHSRTPLSNAMVKRYNNHYCDLRELKSLIREYYPKYYVELFGKGSENKHSVKSLYGKYIYTPKKMKKDDFYKQIESLVKDNEHFNSIIEKINADNFLLKQRTVANGAIPHQLHEQELREILVKQGEYYTFLRDNLEDIVKIFKFKIPYYVGPLSDKEGPFNWLEKKVDEKITPLNFDEVVDKEKTAENFILKMTNKDTYLPAEDVLPKNSIIYQKYTIFNELTKVKGVNEQGKSSFFDGEIKQEIFDVLFKKNRKVTTKHLQEFFNQYHPEFRYVAFTGVKDSFNASFSVYHDLVKVISKNILDNDDNLDKLEEIIFVLTIFNDREIIQNRLQKFSDLLTLQQIKDLSRKKYKGWGQLSRRLLVEILNEENQKSILDYLIDDPNGNRNLMQLISDEMLSFKKSIEDESKYSDDEDLDKLIEKVPVNFKVKKGIRQAIYLVKEIIDVMGYAPKNIVIEMAKEDNPNARSKLRRKVLEELLKKLGTSAKSLLKELEETTDVDLQKEKVYLYFLQNGKDMYQDKELNFASLLDYQVDHIIPQSVLPDDSLDNKVLTHLSENQSKQADVPHIDIVRKRKKYWEYLHEKGCISHKKLQYLTLAERGGLSNESVRSGFINRQLVETRIITKYVSRILNHELNKHINSDVKILQLKSKMVSDFRKTFGFYKIREVNHYHHAHDAYLSVVVANAIVNRYPNLEAQFTQGQYKKIDFSKMELPDVENSKAHARYKMAIDIFNLVFKNSKSHDGPMIFSADTHIPIIKKTLDYPQINIVKKPEVQTGGFFKQNIVSDGKIRIKNYLDPEKYGGYTEKANSYTVFYVGKQQLKSSEKGVRGFLSIPLIDVKKFEENSVEYIVSNTNATAVNKIIRLPKYTLFLCNGYRRLLISDRELHKGDDLFLTVDEMRKLYQLKKCEDIAEQRDAIMYFIEKLQRFAKEKGIPDRLIELKNIVLDNTELLNNAKDELVKLFQITKYGVGNRGVKFSGINISDVRFNSVAELKNAIVIYQSKTGLYETRIDLEKLQWDGEQSL